MMTARLAMRLCAEFATLGAIACSGPAHRTDAAQGVAITITPDSVTLAAGSQFAFTASVTGTADSSTAWRIAEGSTGGAITGEGIYTAPQTPGTYHVVATSRADATMSAVATVTVAASTSLSVSLTQNKVSLDACQMYTFHASVSGSSNTGVSWTVSEGSTGGKVTGAGVYTAPPTGGTYHVVATSVADPTKYQSATVTVTERIVSIGVASDSNSVEPGGSMQFTATVTTTCGTFTATQAPVASAN